MLIVFILVLDAQAGSFPATVMAGALRSGLDLVLPHAVAGLDNGDATRNRVTRRMTGEAHELAFFKASPKFSTLPQKELMDIPAHDLVWTRGFVKDGQSLPDPVLNRPDMDTEDF
ncbi:MAG: hypothetical protein HQL18_00375 [Candidatus Omnitrophica bacterium]|nr:hypothetical protein [Candidatus Omnitrophota bacterium]